MKKITTAIVLTLIASAAFAQSSSSSQVGEKAIECCSTCPPQNHNSCSNLERNEKKDLSRPATPKKSVGGKGKGTST